MKTLLIGLLITGVCSQLGAQSVLKDLQVSAGVSACLYQSVFSFDQSVAFETACRGRITRSWAWQTGARLGLNPALPEGFVRLLAVPELGAWQPAVGIEFALTTRARFDRGDQLLQEMRAATEKDISPYYLAG